MDSFDQNFQQYFCPSKEHPYWQWVEKVSIIEAAGQTVCFREDLLQLLDGWTAGLPHFANVLCLMGLCKMAEEEGRSLPAVASKPAHLQAARLILDLPKELRTGLARRHLLETLCEDFELVVSSKQAPLLIGHLQSGQGDLLLEQPSQNREDALSHVEKAVKSLNKRFANAGELQRLLKTGISEEIKEQDFDLPEEEPSLYDLLLQDPKTEAIARLSKRVLASLHIPIDTSGLSEQSMGGVSDISNRGKLDQMLLTELANEEDILMARLANNEALYLKREAIPQDNDVKRSILIDSSIKMWGNTRTFAIATAIGCLQKLEEANRGNVYSLGGEVVKELDFASVDGVNTAVHTLDPYLDCSAALQLWAVQQKGSGSAFLITSAEALQSTKLQSVLRDNADRISFIIAVNREGEMNCYSYGKAGRRLLSSSQFELDQLWEKRRTGSAPEEPASNAELRIVDTPAFMQEEQLPLLLPTHRVQISPKYLRELGSKGVIGLSENGLMLYWPERYRGAYELARLPKGFKCCWAYDDGEEAVLALYRIDERPEIRIYKVDLENLALTHHSIKTELSEPILQITYADRLFRIRTKSRIEHYEPFLGYHELSGQGQKHERYVFKNRGQIKKHLNTGYSIVHRADKLFIQSGRLVIDKWVLTKFHHSFQIQRMISEHLPADFFNSQRMLSRGAQEVRYSGMPENYRLFEYQWPEGSLCYLDHRGLMHFQSSDPELAAFSIVLNINHSSAGWAADGFLQGYNYYIPPNAKTASSRELFYDEYLDPFIQNIERLCK